MATSNSRRTFLKAGLVGTVVLAAAGGWYRMSHPAPPAPFRLEGDARTALDAISAAMLAGALPLAPAARAAKAGLSDRVLGAIAGLPLNTQREIQDLFALLGFGPARRWLAGVPDDWSLASTQDINTFLQSWRLHRLDMLQSAYHALHDLIIGSWYADESTWASIGYAGPPKELS